MPDETYKTVTINGCARCGQRHEKIVVRKFKEHPILPSHEYFAMCPTHDEPILIAVLDDKNTGPID